MHPRWNAVCPLALALALAGWLAVPAPAAADIIDYDPRTDTVPEILTPAEISRYSGLRSGVRRPSVVALSPDGGLALVNDGGLRVLDTGERTTTPIDFGGWNQASQIGWTGDATGVALGSRRVSGTTRYARLELDLAAATVESFDLEISPPAGKSVIVYANRLHELPDGSRHVSGFTLSAGASLADFEAAEDAVYDVRPLEDRGVAGAAVLPAVTIQVPESVVVISLDDGSVTEVGSIPVGANPYAVASSLSHRPGTSMFAFARYSSIPWRGTTIAGRSNRGGFMPASYIATREDLGRLPESENPNVLQSAVHIVDLEAGSSTTLAAADFAPGKLVDTVWTADGTRLLATAQMPAVLEGREHPIYGYAGGTALKVFSPEGELLDTWSRPEMSAPGALSIAPVSGTTVRAAYPSNLTLHVAEIDIADPAAAPRMIYDGDDRLLSYAAAGNVFVASTSNIGDPGELRIGSLPAGGATGELEAVTANNAPVRSLANVAVEVVEYTTTSGYTVRGAYAYPADTPFPPPEPMPLVVWQQGGPGGVMFNDWGVSVESPYTLLPAFGIPVFVVNGAGRLSNGGAFYTDMADGTNFGQRDIQDVKDGVEELIERGIVDPAAVGVTGCSYGGYFTLQSIVEHPDFYAAANSQCSLNDLMYEYNFGWSPFLGYLVGGTTTDNTREYLRDSPTYRAHEIQTPLLQFHGTSDFLFFEHITNIHDQVAANGTPSRFFRPIGYGHGIGSISGVENSAANGQRYAFQLQLDWFRRYLTPPSETAFDRIGRLVRPILGPIAGPGVPAPAPATAPVPMPSLWEVR